MPGLPVPFVLCFAVIEVMLQIINTLDLLKGINNLIFLFLIRGKVKPLIAVPVDILLGPVLIDMLTVRDIETAVIVFWIISTMLAGPAIVPCHFHR